MRWCGSGIQEKLRERGKAKTGRTESGVKTVKYLDLVGWFCSTGRQGSCEEVGTMTQRDGILESRRAFFGERAFGSFALKLLRPHPAHDIARSAGYQPSG